MNKQKSRWRKIAKWLATWTAAKQLILYFRAVECNLIYERSLVKNVVAMLWIKKYKRSKNINVILYAC